MKSRIYIVAIALLALYSFTNPGKSGENDLVTTEWNTDKKVDICWKGVLNGRIPVFVHYQFDNEVVMGEIVYLNTKNKLPIKLIGTIDSTDHNYRLLEFDKTGNITGVITGTPEGNQFNGTWFSPKTRKELTLSLSTKDTVIVSKNYQPDFPEIFGDYYYHYSETGTEGDFKLTQVDGALVLFNIFSVTGIPALNVAEIERDTVRITETEFIYKVPGTNDCELKVKFYKDFVYVKYTKGTCEGQFGHNATVDGIFIKIK